MSSSRERAVEQNLRAARLQFWFWRAVIAVPVAVFVGAFLLLLLI